MGDDLAALRAERDALRADNAFLGYVVHGPLLAEQEARATKIERDALRAENERLRDLCSELIALYDNGLIACAGTVPKVIEEIRAALTAPPEPEYTREEMREACRNNYNAGSAASNFGQQLDAALPNADAHNDLVAQVAKLRADVAAIGNALATIQRGRNDGL